MELKSHAFEGKNKKVSAMCMESSGKNLLLGTEGGNMYTLDANTLSMSEDVVYKDVVMQKWVYFLLSYQFEVAYNILQYLYDHNMLADTRDRCWNTIIIFQIGPVFSKPIQSNISL